MKVATIYKRPLDAARKAAWDVAKPCEWTIVEPVVRAVKSMAAPSGKVATKYVEASGFNWKIQLVEI